MEDLEKNSDAPKEKVSPFQALKNRLKEQMEYLQSLAQKTQSAAESALEKAKEFKEQAFDKIEKAKEQTLESLENLGDKIQSSAEQLKEKAQQTKEQAEIYLLESSRKVHQSTADYLSKVNLPKIYFGIIESHVEYVAHKVAENAKGALNDKTDEWLITIVDSVYEFMPLPVRLVFKRENFRDLCLMQKARLYKLAMEFYTPPPQLQAPDSPPTLPA